MNIGKVILGIALLAVFSSANAVQVLLVKHEFTAASGFVNIKITDGSGLLAPSNAVWDWDGTSLTSTGTYNAALYYANNPAASSVAGDSIVDLSIDTAAATASATSFICYEGTFLATVGASGCGNYSFGPNFIDESTTTWGPGTSVSQTIGGDDMSGGPVGSIADYDFGLTGVTGTGMSFGDLVKIGNGIEVGIPSGELMTFQVVPVPAAAWLFGSALGLLGWMRRKTD
ncbi:MAG: VPLPA-CTERM sorting domain-containing protein [Gammaproteobacteria bacterium]